MKADQGRKITDQRLSELERKIKKEYEQAEKELKEKLDEHFRLFEIKDKTKLRQLNEQKITFEDYKKWRLGQIATGDRWETMRRNIADDLANRTQLAKSMTKGYMPEVYALNMNYATYDIEKDFRVDTSFSLYNAEAVERVISKNPELLPPPGKQMKRKIAMGEAVKWEEGQIQSVVTQALLQGESVSHMADRIAKTLCVKDRKAAIRYARTAITEAENAGRMDSYRRASERGLKIEKMWGAVLDSRTRPAHRHLDGVTIPWDEPFVNEFGSIMYPGDPDASSANVWNCRCGMIRIREGHEKDASDLSLRNTSKLGGMSYEEWKKGKAKSQDIETPDKIAELMRKRYIADYRR